MKEKWQKIGQQAGGGGDATLKCESQTKAAPSGPRKHAS